MDLESLFIVGLYSAVALASGAFLVGFVSYTAVAVVRWFHKRQNIERIWGGLAGVLLHLVIFTLTFNRAYPEAKEFLERVIGRLF
ncbi:MAG: hypothetical protein FH749_01415 [Firmicutes bacterium]|nr:hypothetical protein [Bacillota bacterium]